MGDHAFAVARVRGPRGVALAGCVAALGVLGGCSDQAKLRESELTQLLAWLPGNYESVPQAAAGAGAPWSAHERIALVVVRVHTPRLGHHSLYVQEMAADDPRRVMSERMFSFRVDEKRGIVETAYTFVEPLRWRDGQQNPVLFTGVQPEDLQSVPGCELLWKKGAGRFTAAPDPARCRTSGAGSAGEREVELTMDFLTFDGYQFRRLR
jgi:CpeT/CpcT family (DUF1001)